MAGGRSVQELCTGREEVEVRASARCCHGARRGGEVHPLGDGPDIPLGRPGEWRFGGPRVPGGE